MSTKLTIKVCLLFLTGLAINRLPSDILADPQASEAVSLGTAKHRPLKEQTSAILHQAINTTSQTATTESAIVHRLNRCQ